MSWLGGSISTITGQLSNFTKDILTEGTEEVSDHATELHLAQGKIRELEAVVAAQKSENDWLKRLNKEFEERAESSELQINSISREYRGVLEEKEKENQSLRQKHHELEEIHVKTIVSKEKEETTEAPVYYSSSHRESGCTDELDFGENISLQYEVNQLRSQVHRLQSECQHWKAVASQMGSEGNESSQLLANIAELQSCNNELQQHLQKEKESRQDEVAALQNMFSQKIALLKKSQKEELHADSIDPVDQHEKSPDNKFQLKLEASEKEISKLQEKVSHLEKELEQSEEAMSELAKTLAKADLEIEKLTQETQEVEELRQFKMKHEATIKELATSSTVVSPQDDLMQNLEENVEHKTELPQLSASNLQNAVNQINSKQSSPSKTQLLDRQLSTLQKQVEKYEQEIEQFEYMKSDWQTEKEALEEVLLGLRNQLKEKEASLNVVQAQRGLAEVEEQEIDDNMSFETAEYLLDKAAASMYPLKMAYRHDSRSLLNDDEDDDDDDSDMSVDIEKFDRQVALLTQANADLEREREYLLHEKHIANDEISYFKGRLSTLEDKYTEKSKNEKMLKEKLKETETLLGKKETEIERLTVEKLDVQNSLEELDAQHQEVVIQLIEIRNELNKKVKDKTDETEKLTKELESLKVDLHTANEDFSKQKEDAEKAYSKEINDLSESKKYMNNVIEDLKEKLQKGAYVVNELHMDKTEMTEKMDQLKSRTEELTKQNSNLKEQLHELTSEIKSKNSEELEVQHKNLTEKIDQLTGHLNQHIETKKKDDREIEDQINRCLKLEKELDELRGENSALNNKYSALSEKYEASEKAYKSHKTMSTGETEDDLQYEIENLISDKNTLFEYISEIEKVFMDYINKSKKIQISEDAEMQIKELETCVQTLKSKLKVSKKGCKFDSECDLMNLLNEREKEVEDLKSEIFVLQKERTNNLEVEEQYAVTLNKIDDLEGQLIVSKQTNAELRKEMEVLVSMQADQDCKESQSSQSKTLGLITDLETELVLAKNKIESLQQTINHLQQTSPLSPNENSETHFDNEDFSSEQNDRITLLEAEVVQGQKRISYFKNMLQEIAYALEIEKVKNLDSQVVKYLKQLQEEEFDDEVIDNKSQDDFDEEKNDEYIRDPESSKCYKDKRISSVAHGYEDNNVQDDFMENDCSNEHSEDMEQLQHIVVEKDKIIQELQNNNSMLLNMIENKSVSIYGDKSLLELHQLAKDVKNLKLEKEQMIAVMEDKTRECSTLKAEVHRLMAIISEERNALDRLQIQNQQLLQSKSNTSVSEDSTDANSMQKEALQKLSNIIRDKDVEIDALEQKNETLLAIFQDSSQNGPQINSLIQEKENFKKELSLLQAERDQIGSYLNQKHQESVAYHGEIQRLNAYIKNEAEKFDKLKQEHEKLMPLFEDKNQLLIKTQNELVNYKQKYSEIEIKYEELFQKSNASEVIDLISYNSKVEEANTLNERLSKLQSNLTEQEQKSQSLMQKHSELENNLREMEIEKNNARKQVDSLLFQLSELNAKLNDSQTEMASSKQQSSEQTLENSTLKEINNKLSLTLQQKEFELRNMTEKANTMTALLQKQQGKESQIDVLIKESEVIRQQALQFQQERDQIILSLKQVQAEKEEMMKELHKLREKDVKQTRELERLRMHLLQIEEGYTKEALESEEREKDLRNKLAAAEEKAFTATAAVETASQQTNYQVENLNQQLHVIASQRDNAYLQLGTLQEQCKQYATSLMNLQIVLEQFQAEKETQMTAEKEKNEAEQKRLNKIIEEIQSELEITKEKLLDTEEGLLAAERLSEQIDFKENLIQQLKAEVQEKEGFLKSADEEIHRLTFDSEAFVEKVIMKNLLLGYLTTPQNKQNDVLRLIGAVLEFSQEDFFKAEKLHQKSWMQSFFRLGPIVTSTPSASPVTTPSRFNKSFSELFVKFLERESSPPLPALKMNTDEVDQESPNKNKTSKKLPSNFNPFTAPRHVALPVSVDDHLSTQGQHLLMAPMAPGFPVLSPVTSDSQSSKKHSNLSSVILNDVLKNKT